MDIFQMYLGQSDNEIELSQQAVLIFSLIWPIRQRSKLINSLIIVQLIKKVY